MTTHGRYRDDKAHALFTSVKEPSRSTHRVSAADITRLYAFEKSDLAGMRRAVAVKELHDGWHEYFRDRPAKLREQN
jgi:hypothetical protein